MWAREKVWMERESLDWEEKEFLPVCEQPSRVVLGRSSVVD